MESVIEEGNCSDGISVGEKKKKEKKTVLTGELWLGPAQRSM